MTRRPRTVLAIATTLVLAVLALFAVALVRSTQDERRDAEQRFQDRARVSAALVESIFASTVGQTGEELAEDFGSRRVDPRALDAREEEGRLAFAAILDERGEVLAGSTNMPPDVRGTAKRDVVVEQVIAGAPYGLGDYRAGEAALQGSFTYALPFRTGFGRRIYYQAFSEALISAFLGGFLRGLPAAEGTRAYVLDGKGVVVGSPVKEQPAGKPVRIPGLAAAVEDDAPTGNFSSAGQERYFAERGIRNSTWRVVLTSRTKDLYAGLSSTVEWLIFLALALAGLASLVMLSRTARAAVEVEKANRQLAASNDELERSNFELQRSNAELEQFASVASHDLQEPLRKVQTFGDQLERRFGEEIPDEGLDYLRRMRAAANRMSVLIDDLLRFSRVTTRALPPEPVDLAKVAREVTSDLDAPLAEAHGRVEIGDLPIVEGDPLQMRQLLQNLIANAIKFHKPGVSPEVRLASARAEQPGHVAFTVIDNGIGIEPEYRERIFRVFERLHPRDIYPGTGIGLALCRKIAERHGGTITVESGPDSGSRFTIELPATQERRHHNGAHAARAEEPVHV